VRVCAFCAAQVAAQPTERVVVHEVIERVVTVEATTGQTSLRCPRCSKPLFEGRTSMSTLLGCGGCGGMWLDNAGTRRLLGLVDAEMVALADRVSNAGKVAPARVDDSKPLRCPVGGEELWRAMVGDVTVDVCADHGTWFDRNELHRIWSQRIGDHRPAHDYGPAAEHAIQNEHFLQELLSPRRR
jgi:Zn-finger nucleic acid-binding protein